MDYLKVQVDFREVIEGLQDDEKGRLFDAMLLYADTGEEKSLFGNEVFIWRYGKQLIDKARAESERLKKNGLKGGRPPKVSYEEENQEEPTETNENQTKPKVTKKFVKPTVDDVRTYCTERKNGVDAERFVDFYESKGWRVGNQPMKDWKSAVRTWEKRDGRGASNGYSNGSGRTVPKVDYSFLKS